MAFFKIALTFTIVDASIYKSDWKLQEWVVKHENKNRTKVFLVQNSIDMKRVYEYIFYHQSQELI